MGGLPDGPARSQDTGRSGVPLHLYYEPGKPVEILPQVLTPSRLVSMVS